MRETVAGRTLISSRDRRFNATFAFVADRVALTDPEHAVLVVDLGHEPHRTFRVITSEI
jgi:hypothetical protein